MAERIAKGSGRAACMLATMLLAAPFVGCQPASPPTLTLIRVVGMEYPWFARMGVIQGAVELGLTVLKDGTVTDVQIKSGPAPLADAAKEAISKWQFAGCTSEGGCKAAFVFSFALTGSCYASEHCPTGFEVDLPGKAKVTSKSIRAVAE
jgi:TonB family protein